MIVDLFSHYEGRNKQDACMVKLLHQEIWFREKMNCSIFNTSYEFLEQVNTHKISYLESREKDVVPHPLCSSLST